MLYLNDCHTSALYQHLQTVYPAEGCGIVLGVWEETGARVMETIATANVWMPDSMADTHSIHDRYEISPQEMLAAMKLARSKQWEIIGIYHSHPDHPARPSMCDRDLAWSQYIYVIVSIAQGTAAEMTAWQLDESGEFRSIPIDS